MYIGNYAKCQVFLSNFNETSIFWTDFQKNTQISNFYENPSSGSRVVPCGMTDRWTHTTKLMDTFRNFRTCLKTNLKHALLYTTIYYLPTWCNDYYLFI